MPHVSITGFIGGNVNFTFTQGRTGEELSVPIDRFIEDLDSGQYNISEKEERTLRARAQQLESEAGAVIETVFTGLKCKQSKARSAHIPPDDE